MTTKRFIQLIVVAAILAASFASTGGVMAWSGCASNITVQWGDTLSSLARLCGTSVEAIQAANPGLGWWIYAGQVLYMPTGYSETGYSHTGYSHTGYSHTGYTSAPVNYQTYGGSTVVQWGDTLGKIAARTGVNVNDILAANPQIWNASMIYAGQAINLPAAPAYYTVQCGDTLRIIANRYGTSVYSLQLLNPAVYDPNFIYPGQVLRVY